MDLHRCQLNPSACYLQLHGNRVIERSLPYWSRICRTLASPFGLCDSSSVHCAKQSLLALQQAYRHAREGQRIALSQREYTHYRAMQQLSTQLGPTLAKVQELGQLLGTVQNQSDMRALFLSLRLQAQGWPELLEPLQTCRTQLTHDELELILHTLTLLLNRSEKEPDQASAYKPCAQALLEADFLHSCDRLNQPTLLFQALCAYTGQQSILKQELGSAALRLSPANLCRIAALGGQLELLQWLASHCGLNLQSGRTSITLPLEQIAQRGHFDLLHWLCEQRGWSLEQLSEPMRYSVMLSQRVKRLSSIELEARQNHPEWELSWAHNLASALPKDCDFAATCHLLSLLSCSKEQAAEQCFKVLQRQSQLLLCQIPLSHESELAYLSLCAFCNTPDLFKRIGGKLHPEVACYLALGGHRTTLADYLADKELSHQIDREGRTPLHYACKAEQLDTAQWLIQQGLDPAAKDRQGRSAWGYCCYAFRERLEQALLSKQLPTLEEQVVAFYERYRDRGHFRESTLLLQKLPQVAASQQQFERAARVLLERGPLFFALRPDLFDQPLEALHALLAYAGDHLAPDAAGYLRHFAAMGGRLIEPIDGQLLLWAAFGEQRSLCRQYSKLLLEAHDSEGRQAIHYAALGGSWIEELSQQGASLQALDQKGHTWRFYAALGGHLTLMCDERPPLELVELLYQQGHFDLDRGLARAIEEKDRSYLIRVQLAAIRSGQLGLVERIEQRVADSGRMKLELDAAAMWAAVQSGKIEMFEWVQSKTQLPPSIRYKGSNLLHAAVESGHREMARYLSKVQGISVDLLDEQGLPLIHRAQLQPDFDLHFWLADQLECDLYAKDFAGRTVWEKLDPSCYCKLLQLEQAKLERLLKPLEWNELIEPMSRFFLQQEGSLYKPHMYQLLQQLTLLATQRVDRAQQIKDLVSRWSQIGSAACHLFTFDPDLWNEPAQAQFALIAYLDYEALLKLLEAPEERKRFLLYAIQGGQQISTVNLLQMSNSRGYTGLHYAVLGGQKEALKPYRSQLTTSFDRHGLSLAHTAAQAGQWELLEELAPLMKGGWSTVGKQGQTLLHAALSGGQIALAQRLIEEKGLDLHAKDDLGRHSGHFAALSGNLTALFWLKSRSVAVQELDHEGAGVVHYAALGGHKVLLERFFRQGLNLLAPTLYSRRSALHFALQGGHCTLATELVEQYGFKWDARQALGGSVLHSAAQGGQLESCEWLVAHYPQLFHLLDQDDHGGSLEHYAWAGGHQRYVAARDASGRIIEPGHPEHRPSPITPATYAAYGGQRRRLEPILPSLANHKRLQEFAIRGNQLPLFTWLIHECRLPVIDHPEHYIEGSAPQAIFKKASIHPPCPYQSSTVWYSHTAQAIQLPVGVGELPKPRTSWRELLDLPVPASLKHPLSQLYDTLKTGKGGRRLEKLVALLIHCAKDHPSQAQQIYQKLAKMPTCLEELAELYRQISDQDDLSANEPETSWRELQGWPLADQQEVGLYRKGLNAMFERLDTAPALISSQAPDHYPRYRKLISLILHYIKSYPDKKDEAGALYIAINRAHGNCGGTLEEIEQIYRAVCTQQHASDYLSALQQITMHYRQGFFTHFIGTDSYYSDVHRANGLRKVLAPMIGITPPELRDTLASLPSHEVVVSCLQAFERSYANELIRIFYHQLAPDEPERASPQRVDNRLLAHLLIDEMIEQGCYDRDLLLAAQVEYEKMRKELEDPMLAEEWVAKTHYTSDKETLEQLPSQIESCLDLNGEIRAQIARAIVDSAQYRQFKAARADALQLRELFIYPIANRYLRARHIADYLCKIGWLTRESP